MTQNEVSIIKNAVLDATEAYVDARLTALDFVKTQIGTTVGNPAKRDGKYYHTVRCNSTASNPNGILYHNVLSVGNIKFPANSVVFLAAPNAQFSNQFILGKLDNTPCNITGGSINIGDGKFTVDNDGNVYCGDLVADYLSANEGGSIANFEITPTALKKGDNSYVGEYMMGCGYAGHGIINLVGGTPDTQRGYIQISDSGTPTSCRGGIRIYYTGQVRHYDDNGEEDWRVNLSDI